LEIYARLLGPGHLVTLESHAKIAKYYALEYKDKETFEVEKHGRIYLQYGLKHAKGQKDLKLKASLY
jgi:Tfp pilus assembly ATPase PilU